MKSYQIGKQKFTEEKVKNMSGTDANALYYATHQGNKKANTMASNPGSYVETDKKAEPTKEDYDNLLRQVKQIQKNMNEPKREIPKLEKPVKTEQKEQKVEKNPDRLDYYTRKDLLEESTNIRNRGMQNRGMSDLDQKRMREIDSLLAKDDKAIKASKTDNYLVHRDRYNDLMKDSQMQKDIDALAMAYSTSEGTRGRGVRAIQAMGYRNSKEFAESLAKKYNLSKEQIDDIVKTYTSDRTNAQTQKLAENSAEFAKKHPVLGSLGSLFGTTGSAVEGAYNALAGLTNDDRNVSRMFNTFKGSLREGASSDMGDVGKTAYNLGMGLADLGVGVASGNAPLLLAGNTTNDAFLTSIDNGADMRNASAYSVGAGIADYLFNKIGLDKAKSLAVKNLKSTGIKRALAQNAIAGAGEAGENVLQDVAQSFLDQLINGENSELQTSYANKIANGMSEDQAFAETAKEYGAQVAMSAGTGYLMGSAMQGVPTLVNNYGAKLANIDLEKNRNNVWNDVEKFEQGKNAEITSEDVNSNGLNNDANESYNDVTGGIENGTDNIQPRVGEVVAGNEQSDIPKSSGMDENKEELFGRGNNRVSEQPAVASDVRQKMNDAGIIDYGLKSITDAERFSKALEEGRKLENNTHGVFVSGKSPEEIQSIIDNGGKVFLTDDNTAGLIVTADGDIEGVFNNTELSKKLNKTGKSFNDLMATAVANGGNKLDCYGDYLAHLYASVGFEPVAGSKYQKNKPWSTEMDSWKSNEASRKGLESEDDINTDVYVFKLRDGWTVDNVIDAIKTGSLNQYANELDLSLDAVNKNLPNEYRNLPESEEYDSLLKYRDSLIKQPNEVASSMPENTELADYIAHREALKDAQKGMNMQEMIENLNQIKAMDAEMAERHPEWYRDGKFVGDEVRQDFSNEMDEAPTEEVSTENIPEENVEAPATTDVPEETRNQLKMNLQFFAELTQQKERLKLKLTEKGVKISERRAINNEIADIDRQLTKYRKTIVNTAVKAGIVTMEDIDNDPELSKIVNYVVHSNAETVAKARQNLTDNSEQIKNGYVSGKTEIKTDQDADQAMLLLSGEYGDLDNYERNAILKNLAEHGTEAGQFIQSLKKYSNTKEGALINATKVMKDETDYFVRRHSSAQKNNNRIASALAMMHDDGTRKTRQPMSREQLEKSIRKTLDKEYGEGKFDDKAISFLADLSQDKKVALWQIVDEIEHYLNHGEFYEMTEDVPEPNKPMNGKLLSALNALVEGDEVEKPVKTFEQLREEVRNTLDNESASFNAHKNGNIDVEFTDSDVDYIAHMIEHGASVADIEDALNTKLATGKFGISDETQAEINRLFEYAKQFDENSEDYVKAQAEAFRLLAEEVAPSATPLEKFDAWRYLAMLGNPKTMLRNFIGNKMFSTITGISNNLAAIMEAGTDNAIKFGKKASNKIFNTNYDTSTGIQRSKYVLNPIKDKSLLKATKADAYNKRARQIEGSKYEKMDKDTLRRNRSVFDSDVMRLVEKAVDRGISDTKAVVNKYSTAMAGYMKANGITEADIKDSYKYDALKRKSQNGLLSPAERAEMDSLYDTASKVDKARDYALKQAEYATFHEDSKIADAISRFSRISTGTKVLTEGLVPFKKTPINIIRSGVEFSPLGLVKNIALTGKLIYENTGNRKYDLPETYRKRNWLTRGYKDVNRSIASDLIESLSRTLTGSGLAALGYYLYNKGILHSSTKDEKYQDDLEGKQNYSIEINGKTYTIDWAVPGSMPLLLGAEIKKAMDANAISDEKWYNNIDEMFGTIDGLLEPVIETSMLQGVQNTLESITDKYDDAGLVEKAMGTVGTLGVNYLSQAIPTLSGQLTRTFDNTRRSTDTENTGFLGKLEKQGRKTMNKTPLAVLNNPYINARGEQEQNAPYDNLLGRFAYQTFSPWYAKDIDTRASDEIAREAYNGLDKSGKPIKNPEVFADWKSNVKINGERLTPEQMYTYREASGKAETAIREALAKEDWFNKAPAETRDDILTNTGSLKDHIGKGAVKADYSSDSKAYNAYLEGGVQGVVDYYKNEAHKTEVKDELGSSSDWVTGVYDKGDSTKYKKALDIANNYGYDSLTKEEYQIYDKKGGVELSDHLKSKKDAEYYGVPNSKTFKEALSNGTAKTYAQAYKAITSTKTGEDDLGNDKFLEYSDTTAQIYKDLGQQGLNDYARLKSNMGDKDSDAEYIKAMDKSNLSTKDKAYYFVLHKGDSVAKSAPNDTKEHTYMWYLAKQKYDSDNNGRLDKNEKSALHSGVVPYLKSIGYSDAEAQLATKWEYK